MFNRPGRPIGRAGLLSALEALEKQQELPRRFGVIMFSIDRFKLINGRFGPEHADIVLDRVGRAATQTLGRRGLLGRWGGDEFLCLVPHADAITTGHIANELRQRVSEVVVPIDASVATVSCSFGVACYPDDARDTKGLLVAADEALREAKHTGRNRVVHARGPVGGMFNWGAVLDTALREDRLMAAYQPIVDLRTGRKVAEEGLARIITTDEKVIDAYEFIDAASQFQMTHKVDRAIVASALRRATLHAAQGNNTVVFVNVSAGLLHHAELVRELIEAAKREQFHGNADHGRVVIEITERELVGDLTAAKRLLAPFLELGLELALDDFGSGYSSFHYLADLPISFLKIDGGLIKRLQEPKIRAIVRGIQGTAEELGLTTLAEYVEDAAQAKLLREIGINWGQGHFFSKALVDEDEANTRRHLSVNWAEGYYYRQSRSG